MELLLLNISLLLTNNKVYKYLSLNTLQDSKDSYKRDILEFIENIIFLSKSHFYNNISYISGITLNIIIRYNGSLLNKKYETINKSLLIRTNYIQTIFDFLITKALSVNYSDFRIEARNYLLQFIGILEILEIYIFTSKATTIKNDLEFIFQYTNSYLFFLVMLKFMQTKNLYLIYKTTLIINSIYHAFLSKEEIKNYQELILSNSLLLLRNLEICVLNFPLKQKQLSIVFLFQTLIDNRSACNLLLRILPRSLFRKVENLLKDISKWTLIEWENLIRNVNTDFDTELEQWNQECRDELLENIKKEQINFYSNWKELDEITVSELGNNFHKENNKFNYKGGFEDAVQLRWNYEEFYIGYNYINKRLPVWRYYIIKIYSECEAPELIITVNVPIKLWEELINNYLTCEDTDTLIIYLKVMIILYKKYYDSIKEVNFINIILNQLASKNRSFILAYYILQFFYSIFRIKDNVISNQNIIKFLDINGFNIVKDYLNELVYNTNKLKNINIGSTNYYNFTKSNLHTYIGANNIYYNKIIFCLKILKICIVNTRNQTENNMLLFPPPICRKIALEDDSVNLIISCLKFTNSNLILKNCFKFINSVYIDKYSYKLLMDNNRFWVYLMYNMNALLIKNVSIILKNILALIIKQSIGKSDNLLINIVTKFEFNKLNCIDTYANNEILVVEEFNIFPPLLLLPLYFWYVLVNKDIKEFGDIFLADNFSNSYLIWGSSFREIYYHNLLKYIEDYNKISTPNSNPKSISKTNSFSFATSNTNLKILEKINYQSLNNHLLIGPIILDQWIVNKDFEHLVDNSNLQYFMALLITKIDKELLNMLLEIESILKSKKNNNISINNISLYLKSYLYLVLKNKYENKNYIFFSNFTNFIKIWYEIYYEHSKDTKLNDLKINIDKILNKILKIITKELKINKGMFEKIEQSNDGFLFKKYLLNAAKIILLKYVNNNEIYIYHIKILNKILIFTDNFGKFNNKILLFFNNSSDIKSLESSFKDIKYFITLYPNVFEPFLEFLNKFIDKKITMINSGNDNKLKPFNKSNTKHNNILEKLNCKISTEIDVNEFIYYTNIFFKLINNWIKTIYNFSKNYKNINYFINNVIIESVFVYIIKFYELKYKLASFSNKNITFIKQKIDKFIEHLVKSFQFLVIILFISLLKTDVLKYKMHFNNKLNYNQLVNFENIINNLYSKAGKIEFENLSAINDFYFIIENILSKQVIIKIIESYDDINLLIDYLYKAFDGLYEVDYILNKEIFNEICETMNAQIKRYYNNKEDNISIIKDYKSKLIEKEICIGNIYLSSYIRQPKKFIINEERELFYKDLIKELSNQKNINNQKIYNNYLKALIEFFKYENMDVYIFELSQPLKIILKNKIINKYVLSIIETIIEKYDNFINIFMSDNENCYYILTNINNLLGSEDSAIINTFIDIYTNLIFKLFYTNSVNNSIDKDLNKLIIITLLLYLFRDSSSQPLGILKFKIINIFDNNKINLYYLNLFLNRLKIALNILKFDNNNSLDKILDTEIMSPYLIYNKRTKEFILTKLKKQLNTYLLNNDELINTNIYDINYFKFMFPEQIENDLLIDGMSLKLIITNLSLLNNQEEIADILIKILSHFIEMKSQYDKNYYKKLYIIKIELSISVILIFLSKLKLSFVMEIYKNNKLLFENLIKNTHYFINDSKLKDLKYLLLQLYVKFGINKLEIDEEGIVYLSDALSYLLNSKKIDTSNINKLMFYFELYKYCLFNNIILKINNNDIIASSIKIFKLVNNSNTLFEFLVIEYVKYCDDNSLLNKDIYDNIRSEIGDYYDSYNNEDIKYNKTWNNDDFNLYLDIIHNKSEKINSYIVL